MISKIKTLPVLLKIQEVDLEMDMLQKRQGTLPKDIDRLQGKIEKLTEQTVGEKMQIKQYEAHIADYQAKNKQAQELVKKYKSKLGTTTDPEAYEELSEALSLQELEVQLAKKKIRGCQGDIVKQKSSINNIKERITETKSILVHYKEKLKEIKKGSEEQHEKLEKQKETLVKKVGERDFLQVYEKLRSQMSVVITKVVDEACNGCFMIVPLQKQIDIRTKKKIITCENCARILFDIEEPVTEPQLEKKIRQSKTA